MSEWRIEEIRYRPDRFDPERVGFMLCDGDRRVARLDDRETAERIVAALTAQNDHDCFAALEAAQTAAELAHEREARLRLEVYPPVPQETGAGALRAYAMALRGDLVEIDVALSIDDQVTVDRVLTRHMRGTLDDDVAALATAPQKTQDREAQLVAALLGFAEHSADEMPDGLPCWCLTEHQDYGCAELRALCFPDKAIATASQAAGSERFAEHVKIVSDPRGYHFELDEEAGADDPPPGSAEQG